MPRNPRQTCPSQLYHVILRGINQQIIFEEKADYSSFLTILKESKEQDHFLVHAYCLMDNHVHLLLQATDVPLAFLMKRLEIRYARWYNYKYERTGYLFGGRYKSCPLYGTDYLLTVFRYIHQNPYHAGIENAVGQEYPWSSFRDYQYESDKLVDRDLLCSLFPSREELLQFLAVPVQEQQMEYFSWNRIPDKEALRLIQEISKCSGPGEFQKLDLEMRNNYLKELLKTGISVRQLSRLTGTTKYVIEKIVKSTGQ